MLSASEVLRASGQCCHIHAAGRPTNTDECRHHDRDWPSVAFARRGWWATSICEGGKEIAGAEENCREEGWLAWTIAVADISKDWHNEVEGELDSYRNEVDLVLSIMEARLEERRV